jgi:hypothetical protein
MSENIKTALALLDVNNDGHWTAEGLPRLDALSEIAGENIKREQLNEVAPEFSRASGGGFLDTTNDPSSDAKPDAADDAPASAETASDADAEMADAETAVADANQAVNDAQAAQAAAIADRDVVVAKQVSENSGGTPAEGIKAFQASQAEQRAKTAGIAAAVRELLGNQNLTA